MNEEPKRELLSRNVLIVLLLVCLAALVGVMVLVLQSTRRETEQIIAVMEAAAPVEAKVNVLEVVDTLTNTAAVAAEGGRYKVLVVDEAREGASGIARIGGLVTFVPDTRRGDLVVVEVTRLKRSTADAVVIERLASGQPVPESRRPVAASEPSRPRPASPPSELTGKTFSGLVTDTGKEGDGVVKLDGKVVFVRGAQQGQRVEYRITEDAGRFARAEVVQVLPADAPSSAPSGMEAPASADREGAPVAVGQELEVEVTEADRRNPEVNGVARVDNFVVFVPETRIGDRVRIRITAVRARAADAEVLERLETKPATP